MNWLYPVFPRRQWTATIEIAILGASVAGTYGALHDQVSYTISPEYFTKLKFRQFAWANLGFSPRLFASEIGFLASWWVGLFAGWLLARMGLAALSGERRRIAVLKAFAIVFAVTAMIGFAGAWLGCGVTIQTDLSAWQGFQQFLGIEDLQGFVIVAYLHCASYLGALVGLLAAMTFVRRKVRGS